MQNNKIKNIKPFWNKELNYQYKFSLKDGIRELYETIQRGMV